MDIKAEIFGPSYDNIDPTRMFFSLNGVIPSKLSAFNLNFEKCAKYLIKEYGDKLSDGLYPIKNSNLRNNNLGKENIERFLFPIQKDVIIHIDNFDSFLEIYYNKESYEKAKDLLCILIRKFKNKESNVESVSHINILYEEMGQFRTHPVAIKENKCNLEVNYNDNFLPIHEKIIKRLTTRDDKGIVLLHGVPGTGKTSYLRHLIGLGFENKSIIYLPPDMAKFIASPKFMPFMLQHQNSILVIEDSENIITKRQGGDNQSVANLLNISDGLLSDCLNMQIICTFNADVAEIDPALRRKGRLIAEYEFGKLNKDKAQKLSDSLGNKTVISEDMTLAEIFNQGDITSVEKVPESLTA